MRKQYTPEQYLGLIPQSAVKQCFIDAPGYNAAWDYCVTPKGRHFISCCAEGTFPEYVKLYEYLPDSNEMKLCFDLEKSLVIYPRTIRPSKVHTSMNPMPDGRLIMATHTTASAPNHPCWMPEAYYTHMWEGFMGSNILIYDPETGKVEDLGIPVPRDTIYGAKYIAEKDCLFFSTYMRGHAYRFDLKDRSVTDYGQCTEFGVYYLAKASDGNLYFTTRSGALWRFDVKTLRPEYTGVDVPEDQTKVKQRHVPNCGRNRNVMAYAANGEDGRLYFAVHVGSRFFAYDPKTNTLEMLGHTIPEVVRETTPYAMVAGMVFDRYGKLWYSCGEGHRGLRLCRIDIQDPLAQPEDFGLIGTEKRVQATVENMFIREDVLYMSDTNHGADAPGVVTVNLGKVREDAHKERILCQDPVLFIREKDQKVRYEELYRGNLEEDGRHFMDFLDQCAQDGRYLTENPVFFGKGQRYACKLWKQFGAGSSGVSSVFYDEDGNVLAYLGAEGSICVTVRDGEILKWEKSGAIKGEDTEAVEKRFAGYSLPAHPGRQYLAQASACGKLGNGSVLVGTKDGMLAVIKPADDKAGKVFCLGAVCNGGAVHDIAVSPDGKRAYGVAGDPDSLGMIFTYDAESGLELCGCIRFEDGFGRESVGVSCEPCCIAVSPDGRRVAVGVRDYLGCVYEFEVDG